MSVERGTVTGGEYSGSVGRARIPNTDYNVIFASCGLNMEFNRLSGLTGGLGGLLDGRIYLLQPLLTVGHAVHQDLLFTEAQLAGHLLYLILKCTCLRYSNELLL